MPTMSILDSTGDTRVEWNPNNAAEVEIARKSFDQAKKKKMLIYKTRADGSRGELLRNFDPQAERIVCTPQTVGG